MTDLAVTSTRAPVEHECHIVTEHLGSVCVVHVTGRLDWASAAQFRDRMRDDYTDRNVIVDLSRTASMDAAGTGVLLAAAGRAVKRGQQLVVVSVDPVEIEVLGHLQLDIVVPIFGSQAEALSWLGEPAGLPRR